MGKKNQCIVNKAIYILFIIILVSTGCSGTPLPKTGRIVSPDAFYEQVSIPERLYIDVDFEQMYTLKSVKQYTVEKMDMDQDKLVKAFLKEQFAEKSIWADGVTFIANDRDITEYLTVYDGGESFGTPTSMKGGFYYSKTIGNDDPHKWNMVACQEFRTPNAVTPDVNNLDFSSHIDLGFIPYAQAVQEIFDVVHTAELPDLVIDETYSLDLATMMTHLQLAQQGGPNWNGISSETLQLTKWNSEDECYIFSLQQLIGELPVDNKGWSNPSAAPSTLFSNKMPTTMITLTYDHSGIRRIQASNLLRILTEEEPVELISGYDALKIVVDHYSRIIIENDIRIISAQLCYVLYPISGSDVTFTLKPGWILSSFSSDGSYSSYCFDMVDAVTGELYPGRF